MYLSSEKVYRELYLLEETVRKIEDDMDKNNAKLEIEEIRWCVKEGLQDLLEGE